MPQGVAKVILTGENARALKAINEVGTASEKAAAKSSSAFDKSTSKVGGAFTKLDRALGSFGVPFTGALGVMGSKLEDTGKRSKGLKDNLSALGGGIALGAAAGFALIGGAAIKAALEGEKAHAQLVVAIKNAGQTEEEFGGKIDATSKHMADFGFENDEVETSIARLTTVTHDTAKAIELQGLAADIAAGRHISLEEATSILVKVESGHVGALGRLGIATKDATGKTISQEEATKKLSELYHGAAAAAANTYAGKIAALQAKAKNLTEELGNKLIPIVEDGVTAVLGTVDAFDSANDATGGWLGKIALAGTAVPVAVFAIDKLAKGGAAVASAYGKVGDVIGKAVTGIKGATTATEAATVATDAGAASYAGLTTAQAASTVADAELVVARGAEATAATAASTANVQLGLALAAVQLAEEGDAVAAAGLIAAKDAATAANLRLAAAAEAAAVAETEAAAAGGGEAAASGLAALTGVSGLALAGVAALAAGVYVLGQALPSATNEARKLAEGLVGTADAAHKAQDGLKNIVGTAAAQDLKDYADQVLSGADAATLAATKNQALADANKEVNKAFTATTGASAAMAQGVNEGQQVFAETDAIVAGVTDKLDDLKKKYGEAAIQSAVLTEAQKEYGDLLASGTASETDLATARDAVVTASKAQHDTQKEVNSATDEGTQATGDNTDAVNAQKEAVKAAEDQLKTYTDAITASKDAQFAARGSVLDVSDALVDYNEKAKTAADWGHKNEKANRDWERASLDVKGKINDVATAAGNAASQEATLHGKTLSARDSAAAQRDALIKMRDTIAPNSPFRGYLDQLIRQLDGAAKKRTGSIEIQVKTKVIPTPGGGGIKVTFADGHTEVHRYTVKPMQKGGPVALRNMYLVGEKGPELFVPSQSGMIIPNGAGSTGSPIGAGVTNINIYAQAIGDRELGRQVVQALREYQRTRGPLNLKIAG